MRMNPVLVRATVVAALGGLLFGFDTAVIAGTTAQLRELFDLNSFQLGFTVSMALWGTVVGSIFAGIPGDRYGRRSSLRLMAILYFVSAAGCAVAWDWYSLMAFRFIGGLGVGGASVLGPMYIAEIAPARWRGRLVGFFQFNVVFGIMLAYFSNFLVGLGGFGAAEWRWKLGIEAAPAAFFFFALFGIPRSPRWLVKQQHIEEARQVLIATGEEQVGQELADIVQSIDAEHGRATEGLFRRKYRLPIFLAVSVAFFNQLTGINAILYYLNDIFASAGFNKVSGDLQSVAVAATMAATTILAMVIIDKVGRRLLLLIGSVGMAICLAAVAAVFFTSSGQATLVWILIGYMAFFGVSQGAVIWVYISEVFPNRVRAKGQSLGSFTHWFMNALVSGTFPMMAESSGGYPFAFFAVMMVVQLVVVAVVYPETKGYTLEEMQKRMGIE